MEKKTLFKSVTRFLHPIAIQAFYEGSTSRLKDAIGLEFDLISNFDGSKTEVYRVSEQVNEHFKKTCLEFAASDAFLNGLDDYAAQAREYDSLLTTEDSIKRVFNACASLYPLMGLAYFVSNYWASELPRSERDKIIDLCFKYRRASDGIFVKLDDFVTAKLVRNGFSPFSTLKMFEAGEKTSGASFENSFIFVNGVFLNKKWSEFLAENGFAVQDEAGGSELDSNELKGNNVYPGVVKGTARIVFSRADFGKVREGDVLVTPMTQVSFTPLYSKIKAIVTDEGGITSHAALIAREFKIPCVVGTKKATAALKDGDVVEVDATNGIVKLINRP